MEHQVGLCGRGEILQGERADASVARRKRAVEVNGGANAGILAAKILATSDPELLEKLKAYTEELKSQVVEKDEKLQETGYKNYAK